MHITLVLFDVGSINSLFIDFLIGLQLETEPTTLELLEDIIYKYSKVEKN